MIMTNWPSIPRAAVLEAEREVPCAGTFGHFEHVERLPAAFERSDAVD